MTKVVGQLFQEPVNTEFIDVGQGGRVSAPLLARTAPHARCKTSLRKTLSCNAWNRRSGSALADRYSACCKARTGSLMDPTAAELADMTALTGPHSFTVTAHERSSGPSLTGGYAVHPARSVLRPPPTPHPAPDPLPGSTPVIGPGRPRPPQSASTGKGLPSSRRHCSCVPRPLRRGVPRGCASRLFTASMAFTVRSPARLSLNI